MKSNCSSMHATSRTVGALLLIAATVLLMNGCDGAVEGDGGASAQQTPPVAAPKEEVTGTHEITKHEFPKGRRELDEYLARKKEELGKLGSEPLFLSLWVDGFGGADPRFRIVDQSDLTERVVALVCNRLVIAELKRRRPPRLLLRKLRSSPALVYTGPNGMPLSVQRLCDLLLGDVVTSEGTIVEVPDL